MLGYDNGDGPVPFEDSPYGVFATQDYVTYYITTPGDDGHYLIEGLSYGDYYVGWVQAVPSSEPDYNIEGPVTIDATEAHPTFDMILAW